VSEQLDLVDERLVRPDLANVVAQRGSLVRVEVADGRLTGFALPEGFLLDVTFRGCRMDLAGFPLARLRRVTFEDCRLEESDFREAQLTEVRFERCDLTRAEFSNVRCTRTQIRRCVLDGLSGAGSLKGVEMTWEDVVAGAGLWAAALGITLLEEDE
jgi:uncharacterized protein YjbI with pentapeptide repeats